MFLRVNKRFIHTLPRLRNFEQYSQAGIAPVFSAKAFNTAWTDYQTGILEKLTKMTVETAHETRNPMAIAVSSARKADEAAVFNLASQAHNNHMFFDALADEAGREGNRPSLALEQRLEQNELPLEVLRERIFAAADSLVGNGWVFLIEHTDKSLQVLAANNAGTPFDAARLQILDLNAGAVSAETQETLEAIRDIASGARDYPLPLLAINVWQHAYLQDFGVAGKQEYLARVWEAIDWRVVSSRLYQ